MRAELFVCYDFDMCFHLTVREYVLSYMIMIHQKLKDKYPNFEVGLKCIIMVF